MGRYGLTLVTRAELTLLSRPSSRGWIAVLRQARARGRFNRARRAALAEVRRNQRASAGPFGDSPHSDPGRSWGRIR